MGATNWSKTERQTLERRVGIAHRLMDRVNYDAIRDWLRADGVWAEELPSDKSLKAYSESEEYLELRQERLVTMLGGGTDGLGGMGATASDPEAVLAREPAALAAAIEGLQARMAAADAAARQYHEAASQADGREDSIMEEAYRVRMLELDRLDEEEMAAERRQREAKQRWEAKAEEARARGEMPADADTTAVEAAGSGPMDGAAEAATEGTDGGVCMDPLANKQYPKSIQRAMDRHPVLWLAASLPDEDATSLGMAAAALARREALRRDPRRLSMSAYLRCLERSQALYGELRAAIQRAKAVGDAGTMQDHKEHRAEGTEDTKGKGRGEEDSAASEGAAVRDDRRAVESLPKAGKGMAATLRMTDSAGFHADSAAARRSAGATGVAETMQGHKDHRTEGTERTTGKGLGAQGGVGNEGAMVREDRKAVARVPQDWAASLGRMDSAGFRADSAAARLFGG